MKYSDRGLADDRFWFNGGLRLFRILFWLAIIFFILVNLGILIGHYAYHGQNFFLGVYRFKCFILYQYLCFMILGPMFALR